ncbi:flagellar biosynthesis protein FlhA [Pseudomonas aeruginosa]
MTDLQSTLNRIGLGGLKFNQMTGPILIMLILGMMVIPLPPLLLDFLFTFNISVALIVLLVSTFNSKALDFSSFPAILLMTTLLRLSLNVASTRIVLMDGHEGPAAAGAVIHSFGEYLVGGNFAVGIALFVIFVVINFMVITKGAGRIAEVGARFTLDAMPGKQMAIDADLNSGLINEAEARQRRKEVSQESDFYGSMDGASKFVRGDAIAGIVIMVVNLVFGMFIGVMQHGLTFGEASQTYTMLTIGDGLVAQIPALMISIAAGVIVARVNTDQDVGQQIVSQVFKNHVTIYLGGFLIVMLGLAPGMPHFAFITFGLLVCGIGYLMHKRNEALLLEEDLSAPASQAVREMPEASWDDVQMVDVLSLQVGIRLIPMVNSSQDGSLLGRIKSVRKKFATEMGFLPAAVHIRDNLELNPDEYTISLKGNLIGRGVLYPDELLAIDGGGVTKTIPGNQTLDPAFGLPAVWIHKDHHPNAQMHGYTVVDASTVAATHLDNLLRNHCSELLGRNEVQHLIEVVSAENKQLAEDVVPKLLNSTQLQRILQALLEEEVSICDLRTIFEILAEHAGRHQNDLDELVSIVRLGLGRSITTQHFGQEKTLRVIGLESQLENMIVNGANTGSLEPNIGLSITRDAEAAVEHQLQNGLAPVLVVSHPIRALLSDFLRKRLSKIYVMSLSEIPHDKNIQVTSTIGGSK